jgi:hypothetical protein
MNSTNREELLEAMNGYHVQLLEIAAKIEELRKGIGRDAEEFSKEIAIDKVYSEDEP